MHGSIAGVDEVGRGALAGPLVVVATILPFGLRIAKLNDSKKLTAKARLAVYKDIMQAEVIYRMVFVKETKIDEVNIHKATLKAMEEVVLAMPPECSQVLVDGKFTPQIASSKRTIKAVPRADSLYACVAAASVIAKVTRDAYMCNILHIKYPQYAFHKNKGYGTKQHLDAIKEYGPTRYHRHSFAPMKGHYARNCN